MIIDRMMEPITALKKPAINPIVKDWVCINENINC